MRKAKALVTIFCTTVLISCSNHFYTKGEAIKIAKKGNIKKSGRKVIEDDNSILKVLTRDSNFLKLDEIYYFNDDGKQLKYTYFAFCDSCFQKSLLKVLTKDGYKWTKFNDSTYISKYSLKRFLNIHKSTYSFDIVQHNLSRNECKNLIEHAEK